MILHYNITVKGKVQGVFYRASSQQEAVKQGIKGWVKNLPDGSVYIGAEGTADQLEAFLTWCRRGPTQARVTQVDFEVTQSNHYTDFKIVR